MPTKCWATSHDHTGLVGTDINNKSRSAQIVYLLEHGESAADIRMLLAG